MPLQTVENRRLYRQIADQIAALIEQGEYGPGERLPPERDLAKQLGVSRPSVREALIALEVEGYVEVRVGSGVYVAGGRIARRASRGLRSLRAHQGALAHRGGMRGARGEVGDARAGPRDRGSA